MSVLQVCGLQKSYSRNVPVLKGIDLTMQQGQVLSVIGSSGSGKTTLLRCLNFLEKPDAGSIAVNGEVLLNCADAATLKDAAIRRSRLHFGLVFQQFNLFPQYTVQQNVALAGRLQAGKDKAAQAAVEEKARALLDRVGLADKINAWPKQLSGGQQQRVAIARALAMDPDILCFDEPTSALDPELTGEVLRVIRDLRAEGRTMIIVTHEMDFARQVSDTVCFMDGGVIVEQGPPEQVFGAPQHQRTKQFLRNYLT